jgi:hypothetical protein
VKQADLRDMFKKAFKSVSTSTIAVFVDLLSSTASSSTIKTQEKQKRTLMNLNHQINEISKWIYLCSLSIGAVTKNSH